MEPPTLKRRSTEAEEGEAEEGKAAFSFTYISLIVGYLLREISLVERSLRKTSTSENGCCCSVEVVKDWNKFFFLCLGLTSLSDDRTKTEVLVVAADTSELLKNCKQFGSS